jgi:hypothetical protein
VADPRLRLGGGARAVEALLFADLDDLLPEGPEGLRRPPVRIVVPSRALRLHLQARLARSRGAVVGLALQSLRGLALSVLDAAGRRPRPGAALLVPLARRAAAREPALRSVLGLEGGARSVAAAVRDLLDAGLDEVNAEAAYEALEQTVAGRSRERAASLVRAATGVLAELERLDLASPASVLREAADLVVTRGEELLPSHAVLVHGFADATGAATELLHALLRQDGARLYLDRPGDPARPDRADSGNAFALRFAERALAGSSDATPSASSEAAELELSRSPGERAEAAAIGRRVRRWIDEGQAPEGVAVLVRHPARQLPALRAEFLRTGLPFSCGQAAGPPGPLARRVEALRRILSSGERANVESWLDGIANLRPAVRSDRLAAFRVLGAPRLRDLVPLGERLASLAGEDGMIRLAQRRGLQAVGGDDEAEDPRAVAVHRKVSAEAIAREVERAKEGLAWLGSRPARAAVSAQVASFRALLTGPLGWSAADAQDRALLAAVDGLAASLPADLELEREDAEALLDDALLGLGRHAAGGAGGGVQLLGVMEARALTFDRLVLAGLNRDSFPRVVREDPLLPDSLRRALNGAGTGVLPDLAEKAAGVDEERFLFAQALSASPQVLLSWCASDEDGKPRPASPLLERLRLERLRDGEGDPVEVPLEAHRHAAPREDDPHLRSALDHAVLAGLHGTRAELKAALPAAMREAVQACGAEADAAALAAVRGRLIDEFDAAPGQGVGALLSPWFGFVGAISDEADPRREDIAVTRFEDLARCGWRSFVSRVLRVEASPDPLGALPSLSRLLLGQVVHDVLERAVKQRLGEGRPADLAGALEAGAVRVSLPPAGRLSDLFEESVARHAAEAGLPLGAFAAVVVERAMELFELARRLDWGEGAIDVLGAELAGEALVALPGGGERRVVFTADRVDLAGGVPRFVDYKTGKPPGEQKGADPRRKAHLAGVAEGRYLQPSAYALAGGAESEGRLLFLKEGLADDARLFAVAASEADFAARFASVVATVDAAWTRGAFLPRLDDGGGDEPKTCGYCEVREACLRGDSGAKLRLGEWARAAEEARTAGTNRPPDALSAALDLYSVRDRAEEASS